MVLKEIVWIIPNIYIIPLFDYYGIFDVSYTSLGKLFLYIVQTRCKNII